MVKKNDYVFKFHFSFENFLLVLTKRDTSYLIYTLMPKNFELK
jgi:hypothetical protein